MKLIYKKIIKKTYSIFLGLATAGVTNLRVLPHETFDLGGDLHGPNSLTDCEAWIFPRILIGCHAIKNGAVSMNVCIK